MIGINKYLENLKASATLAINKEVQLLKSKGEDIVHFGFGQSPFPVYKGIVNELQNNAAHNEYLPTLGLKSLRIQISNFLENYQNIERDWSTIFIGPGSKELLYHSILILEGEFLIPKGSWVSYLPQIKIKGGKFTILETDFSNSFKLNAETLKDHCQKSPDGKKILILNSPNNPTGAVYSKEELMALAEICRTYKIIVLSDEIYSQINFSEVYSPSISTFYPDGTIVFGGLSKVFSAGGYRLGFVALPNNMQDLIKTYRAVFSETFSAVASPIQYAAIEAFKMSDGLVNYINTCKDILRDISSYLYQELDHLQIECTQPQGAFYMMIGFSNYKNQINGLGIKTSNELANHLLRTYHIALLPGSEFYLSNEDLFLRLAYVDFDGEKLLENYNENIDRNIDIISENCPKIAQGVKHLKAFVKKLNS